MKRLVLTFTLLSFFTIASFAQFPVGGNTPTNFPGLGGVGSSGQATNFHAPENWLPDSVPLRITRFQLSPNGFYLQDTIDTIANHFEIIRPQQYYNDAWLGYLAAPWYPTAWDQRVKQVYRDFYFLSPLMDRLYLPSNNFFFKTNRPYTDLYYVSNFNKNKEEQVINTLHTQNVDLYTNFGLSFNSYTSKEPVSLDNSALSTLYFWLSKEHRRWRFNFVAFLNTVKIIENGGVIDSLPIYNPESPQYYLTNSPMNRMGFRGISFNPEYILRKKGDSAKTLIETAFNYARHTRNYSDNDPRRHIDFYNHYYLDSTKIYDSVSYDRTNLETSLKFIKPHQRLSISLGTELQTFYYFTSYIYQQRGRWFLNQYIKFGFDNYSSSNINYSFGAKAYTLGRKSGELTAFLWATKSFNNTKLTFNSNFQRLTPDFFLTIYTGNVARWYNPEFNRPIYWQNQLILTNQKRKLLVDLQAWYVKNHIYFYQRIPAQYNGDAFVLMLRIRKDLRLKFLRFDNQVLLQYTNANQIFNLPLVRSFSSLWFDFYLFKRALHVNAGTNIYWNSGFRMYRYDPSIMAFYLTGNDLMTGFYPIANVFLNFKVQRATIFLKFEFIDAYLYYLPYYSTVLHYHYPSYYVRYGVRWWFKN